MSEKIGPVYAPNDYAGFFRRSAALVIDALILGVAGTAAPWIWYLAAPRIWVTREAYYWIWIAWLIGSFEYLLGFRMTEGGTPGYRLVGIRYASVVSERPTRLALVYRALVAIFLLWGFIFDHFWILVDERKQAWHDKLSGFYVVKRKAEPIGTQRVVRRVINFMTLTFEVWEPAKDR